MIVTEKDGCPHGLHLELAILKYSATSALLIID